MDSASGGSPASWWQQPSRVTLIEYRSGLMSLLSLLGPEDGRGPTMSAPVLPRRESCRRVIHGFAAVQLPRRRDADGGSPAGELLVGDQPGRVRLLGQASVEPFALLVRRELEVADLHR